MNALDHFIEELIERSERRGPFRKQLTGIDLLLTVYLNFLSQRTTTRSIDTCGLHPRLTAHGQNGESWRHIRLHCGCQLIGWPLGLWMSSFAARLDNKQAKEGRLESLAEVASNMAGIHCGKILSLHLDNLFTVEQTHHELQLTLAENKSSLNTVNSYQCSPRLNP